MVTLRGRGLILRPLDVECDAEALHAVFSDPESVRFLARSPTRDLGETRRLLEGWQTAPQWAITEDGEACLGRITLVPVREAVAEIGLHVIPAARGRRLGARAVAVLTEHALASGHIRIAADIDPGNIASIRTFERVGFAYEGRLRHNWMTHTGPADSVIYAATDGWRATV